MKTITLKGVDVVYEVPDSLMIKEGTTVRADITQTENNIVKVYKKEPVSNVSSNERTYTFRGDNYTITHDVDNHRATGTLTLRPSEDWKAIRSKLIEEFTNGLDKLLASLP